MFADFLTLKVMSVNNPLGTGTLMPQPPMQARLKQHIFNMAVEAATQLEEGG